MEMLHISLKFALKYVYMGIIDKTINIASSDSLVPSGNKP